jgi:hypothetical protein
MARNAWRATPDSIRRGRQDATRSRRMSTDGAIRDAMVAAIPQLRRFAVSLSNAQQADDLVPETLLLPGDDWQAARKALVKQLTRLRDQFGTERHELRSR